MIKLHVLFQSDDLAAGLMSCGVVKGDRVGIWAPNGLEWILAKYAAARAGLILVIRVFFLKLLFCIVSSVYDYIICRICLYYLPDMIVSTV